MMIALRLEFAARQRPLATRLAPLAFLRAVLYGGNWRRPTRFGFVAAIAALYAGAFALLYPVYGPSLAALATAPVLAAGVLLGVRPGFAVGLLAFPLNTLLLNLVGVYG